MTEKPTPPETAEDRVRPMSSRRILWQLSVFLVGFLLLLGLNWTFNYLIDELDEQLTVERARVFVGEQIVGDIRLVESQVYKMATTLGERNQQRARGIIDGLIDGIDYNLGVLRHGGVAHQLIRLNLSDQEQMIIEVPYQPTDQVARGYVLEIIDLTPKLQEIETKADELMALLAQRERMRVQTDQAGLFEMDRHIKIFLKKLPPLFNRLTENANRMFFESHQRMARIEQRIAEQTRRYHIIELIGVASIITAVMLLGLMFARQIERSNKQLADARDRMSEAKEEAERANRAKSDFLSRMSHELRTPLNAILGFSQVLALDEALSGEQRDSLQEIDKAGRHLLSLINEILDIAKIEAGHLELEDLEYSIADLADEVVGIMAAKAHDKGLALHAFVTPALPNTTFGDPTRVKQVLLNLLGNAVKFTEDGEVSLKISFDAQAETVRFEIRDSGIGFDTETRKRLFRPFTQADESITRQFGGTGLGLVICKELVEAMGGSIDAESVHGEGSRFWFDLPVANTQQPYLITDPRYAGLGVLIVNDHPDLRHTLESYLAALGAHPVSVVDELSALAALRQGHIAGQSFRILLVDAVSQQGGMQRLFQELKADVVLRPSLLCLMQQGVGVVDDAFGRQFDLILHKPVTVLKLRDLLDRSLSEAKSLDSEPLSARPAEESGKDTRVLLAEDTMANRKVAELMLKRLGVQAESVENGWESVDAFQRGGFDLVFMDMQMPIMDGLEATRQIRRHESEQGLPRTPIVAMTANAMESDRERCLEAGMDDHLPKPISIEGVEKQLRRWIAGYDSNQA